jgi:iron complex outermembrane receptor protein
MNDKRLLAGTALALLFAATPALAQNVTSAASSDTQVADNAAMMEEIIVYGRGEARQVQGITAAAIALEAPGTSPLKAIEKLPGVSFQSADPFGAYEWSARVSIRGFNQTQLGFTLDGVPLGDMSYGNHNGLHISRAISSENVGTATVAQGAGSLATASTSNLGGTVQFTSRDPSKEAGALVSGTFGSENTARGFVRLETGELDTGTRAYLSYTRQNAEKWKGDGIQRQDQLNFKAVQPVGEGTLTGWVNWSDRRENDYQDLSLSMIDRLGYDWDNFAKNWALAVQVADIYNGNVTGSYPSPVQTVDDAYYDAAGLRKDTIGALTLNYPISDNVSLDLTGYGHKNEGQGVWYTPYVQTPGGAPISIRTTEYDIERYGAIGGLTVELGDHKINGGFWREENDFNQARRFYALNRASPGRSSTQFQTGPFYTQWEYDFDTETTQFHLSDSWTLTDELTINAGFKSMKVENTAKTVTGDIKNGTIESKDNFLPQVGFLYDLTADHQIFGSYAENMRAFESSATSGPFGTSLAGFNAIKDSLKPESSRTFELGWRFHIDQFQGVLAAYDVKFDNRLLSVTLGSGIQGNPSALQNVGGVTTRGVEAAGTYNITDTWSIFGSYSFNDSTYDDSVAGADIKDKTVVNSPKHLLKGEVSYDDGNLFGKVGASYTSKRYYTYLNDGSVDGYALVDASVGYRFEGGDWLEGLEIQANVTNLFDKEYVSTIGSNGYVNSDPDGLAQTLLAGSPRQFFVTLKKQF